MGIIDHIESLTEIIVNFSKLITDIENFVEYATWYVFLSAPLLVLMFLILLVQWGSIKKIKSQNKEIMRHLGLGKKE